MNQYSRTLKRISKTVARRLYNSGKDILFIPNKLNPDNDFYLLGIWENKDLNGQYKDFETLCNYFKWYNCNRDTGNTIAFYIKTV